MGDVEVLGRRVRRPIWLGSLRRTTPIDGNWGFDRGQPIDRYFIEAFLERHSADVRGACLETGSGRYTERFGSGVTSADVLDVDAALPGTTIVADLTDAGSVPSDRFDCFLLTQTLQFVRDVRAALWEAHRVLRSGGVLLVTAPALSKIDRRGGPEGDLWRFTHAGLTALLDETFGPGRVDVQAYGNVLTAVAFLMGLACDDLSSHELDYHDEDFPVLVAARAVKTPA